MKSVISFLLWQSHRSPPLQLRVPPCASSCFRFLRRTCCFLPPVSHTLRMLPILQSLFPMPIPPWNLPGCSQSDVLFPPFSPWSSLNPCWGLDCWHLLLTLLSVFHLLATGWVLGLERGEARWRRGYWEGDFRLESGVNLPWKSSHYHAVVFYLHCVMEPVGELWKSLHLVSTKKMHNVRVAS